MHLRKHHVDNLHVSVFVLPFGLRNLSVFPFMSHNVAPCTYGNFIGVILFLSATLSPTQTHMLTPIAAPSLSHRVPVILLLLTPRSFNIFLSTSFGSLKWPLFKLYSTVILFFSNSSCPYPIPVSSCNFNQFALHFSRGDVVDIDILLETLLVVGSWTWYDRDQNKRYISGFMNVSYIDDK